MLFDLFDLFLFLIKLALVVFISWAFGYESGYGKAKKDFFRR